MVLHVSPAQESYEIGSIVTLTCTATPPPQKYENFTFPLTYQWYSADRGSFSSGSTVTITIASYEQSFGDIYCLIYRSGLLLGKGRITLKIKGKIHEKRLHACLLAVHVYR